MGVIVPYVFIAGAAMTLSLLKKSNFGTSLAIALLAIPLPIYLFGIILGSLQIGFYLETATIPLLFAYVLWRTSKQHSSLKHQITPIIKSPTFIAFTLLYFMLAAYDSSRGFTQWDEWSHWGMMVREMLRLDAFYASPNSVLLVHQDYPPYLSLFEYVFCKLSDGYNEAVLENAIHVYSFGICFLPLGQMERNPRFRFGTGFVAIFFAALILLFAQEPYFNTIYVDLPLGITVAVGFYAAIFSNLDRQDDRICLTLLLTSIILTKQIGIFFVLLILSILVFRLFFHYAAISYPHKTNNDKILPANTDFRALNAIPFVVVPFLFALSWRLAIGNIAGNGQFSLSKLSLGSITAIFTGNGLEQWRIEGFWNLLEALQSRPLFGTAPLQASYLGAIIAFSVIVAALYLLFKKQEGLGGRECLLIIGSAVVGGALYALSLAVSYTFGFSEQETKALASWSRYARMFVISISLLVTFATLRIIATSRQRRYRAASLASILFVFLLILPSANLNGLKAGFEPTSPRSEAQAATTIVQNTDSSSSILIISKDYKPGAVFFIGYYAYPRWVRETTLINDDTFYGRERYAFPEEYDSLRNRNSGDFYSEETTMSIMAGYDFVFVFSGSNALSEAFPDLFPPQC